MLNTWLDLLLPLTGVIATVWIVIGVIIAGFFYPNYDHQKQFCSELGAIGSPTEKLSPRINNYPLGLLFCLFGWYLTKTPSAGWPEIINGYLIIAHGIGTWVAGYFPMDADPYTKEPSNGGKIHSWAGFIMIVALLLAPLVIVFSAQLSTTFKLFSVFSLLASIYFMRLLTKAYRNKTNVGTYQRLSYGVQLFWLSGLSVALSF